MRSITTTFTLTRETLPAAEAPLCFAPADAEPILTELMTTWQHAGSPSTLLHRESSVADECHEHDVLLIKHRSLIQGYVTYRALGGGTLQELAEDPDSLDISNYFYRHEQAILPQDLQEFPVLDTYRTYRHVVFINKIETLPNQCGYGTALVEALRDQTRADLVIVHAVDQTAERFFEKNDFDYPGIYNGSTEPEVVMAWCKPRRTR